MKRILARNEYCIGCHLCEVYCAAAHSPYPHDLIKVFKGNTPPPSPRVRVEEAGAVSFALQCRHCADPHCTKACITGAMYRDPATGAVMSNPERCVGCWTCILVCPYGAVFRDATGRKVISKCDFCLSLGEPACVQHCPNRALIITEGGA
ncbi:MAG TPA: 4Fe-4S dicluster domain-containing protein [Clostridia bacterium]|nr:4Fe-4S dicluster domain-containing protein [Clostridia bacterium]